MKNRGFTIIETLFVLAIAGLILLLIFLLIPVLARNGRNNQRQQEVSAIIAAVSHYELNNSGDFPITCGTATLCGTPGPGKALSNTKLTFYDDTTNTGLVRINKLDTTSPPPTLVVDPDSVEVDNYSKCGTSSAPAPVSAGFNNFVVLYALETGGAASPQCRQL